MSWKRIFLLRSAEGLLAALMLFSAVSCGEASPQQAPEENGSREQLESRERKKPAVLPKKKKAAFADREEGSFKVRFSSASKPEEKAQVKIDYSSVTVFPGQKMPSSPHARRIARREREMRISLRTKCPATALCTGITGSNASKLIRWYPQMRSDTTHRSRIECCAVSTDESVILFVENVGEDSGPFGSRLVFLDTHSWKILAVHYLKEHYVKEVSFLRDGSCLLSCRGQEQLRSKDCVIHFDTVVFQRLSQYRIDGLQKAWAVPDGKHFFVTYRKESPDPRKIDLFALNGSRTDAVRTFSGENAGPVVTFSRDGTKVYFCGDRSLESRRWRDGRLLEKIALPEGFICADLLYVTEDLLIASPEDGLRQKSLAIRKKGKVQSFGEISAGRAFAFPPTAGQQQFGALLSRKGKVGCYALPALDEILEIFPESCRERTEGNPWYVFVLKHCPEAFAVLDQRGNFYLLYRLKTEKHFRKEILISSMSRKEK